VRTPFRALGALAAITFTAAACGSSGDDVSAPDTVADAGATASADCPPADGTDEVVQQFDAAPPFCLDDGVDYSATVITSQGELEIDLDEENAPATVNNFVFLARNNYFDDTICHRVIQGFVVQCGDPTATGTGNPGYRFADELPEAGTYEIGTLAMANSGPDTNGSQFFIISGEDGTLLPPLYSQFGQTSTENIGVVEQLDALGSTDGSGVSSEEVRIIDVVITES
jgi:cyclophilin family peptidyl-prolyl cis-trans isomerase